MNNKKKKKRLTEKQATKLARNWQRFPTYELPDLFFAYDTSEEQTERIVSFYLPASDLKVFSKLLTKQVKKYGEDAQLVVRLGVDTDKVADVINAKSAFVVMLQIQTPATEGLEGCFRMQWEPNPQFPTNPRETVLSGENAIPAAAAFLFIHHWLETPDGELAEPFESDSYQIGKRVKGYRFAGKETGSIEAKLAAAIEEGNDYFQVYLGRGISVSTHPFSFRPVVGVGASWTKSEGFSRLESGDDDGYFDFSRPFPPG